METINYTFEEAMTRISEIVSALESSQISLDESLRLFEEGTGLVNFCNSKIEEAQEKVNKLILVKPQE